MLSKIQVHASSFLSCLICFSLSDCKCMCASVWVRTKLLECMHATRYLSSWMSILVSQTFTMCVLIIRIKYLLPTVFVSDLSVFERWISASVTEIICICIRKYLYLYSNPTRIMKTNMISLISVRIRSDYIPMHEAWLHIVYIVM
jgi:hypothetical protein